jgi:hypothetical protein
MDRTWTEITDIALPAPRRKGGMPLMEALNRRESSRELTSEPLDMQTLSDLLWAAWGYNREYKRTAPSSHNRQEIDLYVFLESGTYIYDAAGNRLLLHDNDDLRSLLLWKLRWSPTLPKLRERLFRERSKPYTPTPVSSPKTSIYSVPMQALEA